MNMHLLYYWQPNNYADDLPKMFAGLERPKMLILHQKNSDMHRILMGENLWAFTRRKRDGKYVLAAELVVARKDVIREGEFAEKYGPYRLSGDPARSRLFDVDRGGDAELLIRGLSVAPKAKHLGQS